MGQFFLISELQVNHNFFDKFLKENIYLNQ